MRGIGSAIAIHRIAGKFVAQSLHKTRWQDTVRVDKYQEVSVGSVDTIIAGDAAALVILAEIFEIEKAIGLFE